MENQSKNNNFLAISIITAAVLIAGAVIYSTGLKNINTGKLSASSSSSAQISAEPQIDDDVVLGDAKAPVTIIEFGDYQCPFCGRFFTETEPLIRKNYIETGKVKMVYKDLAFLGPESTKAAEAADCAKDQGKYWEYHDALFSAEVKDGQENSGNLNRNLFQKIASDLKMNVNDFLSCYDSEKYKSDVDRDGSEARAAMSDRISTPTFFINGKMLQGAYPYDTFVQMIDGLITNK